MGFLDAIFGRKEKAPEKPLEMGIAKLKEEAQRELSLKMKPFYSEAPAKAEAIMAKLGEVREVLGEFSKKPIKTENPQHENIARQMKENFFVRIPKIIENVAPPKGREFADYREFHAHTVQAMAQITKITSDNRYLLFFFKEEFEKLGGPVKELAKMVDGMGEALAKEEGKIAEYDSLMKKIGSYEEEGKAQGEADGKIGSMREEIGKLQTEMEKSGKPGLDARKGELSDAKSTLQKNASFERDRIAAIILPLERIIRKYMKISTDKKIASEAEAILGNHIAALSKPEGMETLGKIAREVDAMLSDGRLKEDSKDLLKHRESISRILSGELEKSITELGKAMIEEGKVGDEIAEIDRSLQAIAALGETINSLEGEIGSAEKGKAEGGDRGKRLLQEIEGAYYSFAGRKIILQA